MLCRNSYGRIVPVEDSVPSSLLVTLGLTPYVKRGEQEEGTIREFTYPVAEKAAAEVEEIETKPPFTLIPLYESLLHQCADLQTTEEVMLVVQGVSGFENFDESDAQDFLNYLLEKKRQ